MAMDDDLRNSLWSLLQLFYWKSFKNAKYGFIGERTDYIAESNMAELFEGLWLFYFKQPLDTIPSLYYGRNGGLEFLRAYFFDAKWNEVYDFIEFVSANGLQFVAQATFAKTCNAFI